MLPSWPMVQGPYEYSPLLLGTAAKTATAATTMSVVAIHGKTSDSSFPRGPPPSPLPMEASQASPGSLGSHPPSGRCFPLPPVASLCVALRPPQFQWRAGVQSRLPALLQSAPPRGLTHGTCSSAAAAAAAALSRPSHRTCPLPYRSTSRRYEMYSLVLLNLDPRPALLLRIASTPVTTNDSSSGQCSRRNTAISRVVFGTVLVSQLWCYCEYLLPAEYHFRRSTTPPHKNNIIALVYSLRSSLSFSFSLRLQLLHCSASL